MGENVVFYAFAYQQILLLFLNNSNKNGVRKHAHSMSHAYLDILVKVSSEMLQNCGNAYVKFNSASFLHDVLIYRDYIVRDLWLQCKYVRKGINLYLV